MAQSLVGLGCPEQKIRVHHLGVEVDKVPFRPRQMPADAPLRVLIAASFREKKAIPSALEALARVGAKLSIEVTIIGDASSHPKDQAEKTRILALLEQTGLRSCTRLLGYQPQSVLWQEALGHHLFLQPSMIASDGDTGGSAGRPHRNGRQWHGYRQHSSL